MSDILGNIVLKKYHPVDFVSQLTKALRHPVSDGGLYFAAERHASSGVWQFKDKDGTLWKWNFSTSVSKGSGAPYEGLMLRRSTDMSKINPLIEKVFEDSALKDMLKEKYNSAEKMKTAMPLLLDDANENFKPQGKFNITSGKKRKDISAPQPPQPVALAERKVNVRADDHPLVQLARKAMSMSSDEMQSLERQERIIKKAYEEEVLAGPMASNASGASEDQKDLHFAQCLTVAHTFAKVLRKRNSNRCRTGRVTIKNMTQVLPRINENNKTSKQERERERRERRKGSSSTERRRRRRRGQLLFSHYCHMHLIQTSS